MNKRTCALHEALFFVIFCGASFACYAASAGKVWAQVETSVVQVKYSMLRWDFVVPSDGESRSASFIIMATIFSGTAAIVRILRRPNAAAVIAVASGLFGMIGWAVYCISLQIGLLSDNKDTDFKFSTDSGWALALAAWLMALATGLPRVVMATVKRRWLWRSIPPLPVTEHSVEVIPNVTEAEQGFRLAPSLTDGGQEARHEARHEVLSTSHSRDANPTLLTRQLAASTAFSTLLGRVASLNAILGMVLLTQASSLASQAISTGMSIVITASTSISVGLHVLVVIVCMALDSAPTWLGRFNPRTRQRMYHLLFGPVQTLATCAMVVATLALLTALGLVVYGLSGTIALIIYACVVGIFTLAVVVFYCAALVLEAPATSALAKVRNDAIVGPDSVSSAPSLSGPADAWNGGLNGDIDPVQDPCGTGAHPDTDGVAPGAGDSMA
eukprot:m.97755 g.97755  ORF g.97755 m.97755 type:complete len:443 (-) comp8678_c0_seq1:73-1401(-)